jgi:hypothetical protein
MKPYAKEFTLSDSVIQDARDTAKLLLFGSPEMYIMHMVL